jgi:hypothetical protein
MLDTLHWTIDSEAQLKRPGPVKVTVAPVEGGWQVVHDLDPLPLMFLSGGRAEAQALLIVRLANAIGVLAQLEIFTRDGRRAPARRPVQLCEVPNRAAITRLGSAGFSKRRTWA